MQVRYESQLIEPTISRNRNFSLLPLDSYTLTQNGYSPLELIAAASNANLLAIYLDVTKQIAIIDTKLRTQRERFPLKPCDKKYSKQSFCVRGLHFSPDTQRLAVGQSDCIIYIYKLNSGSWLNSTGTGQAGLDQGDLSTSLQNQSVAVPSKPTITGKFVCSSPITCLIWEEPGIIFGTQDGKIKLISFGQPSKQQANDSTQVSQQAPSQQPKVVSLYASQKGVMPLSLAYKQPFVIVGFMDGSVLVLSIYSLEPINVNDTANELISSSDVGPDSLGRHHSSLLQTNGFNVFQTFEHSSAVQKITVLTNYQEANQRAFQFCCSGNNGRLGLYELQHQSTSNQSDTTLSNSNGNSTTTIKKFKILPIQHIDLNGEDINGVDYSPVNEMIAVATNRRLAFIKLDSESSGSLSTRSWRLESAHIETHLELGNRSLPRSLHNVKWARDGTNVVVGTLVGSLELFQCSWFKESVGEQLDICHIAKNRVRISDKSRNLLATYKLERDIKRVNVIDNGRSVIIWSSGSTLLLARLGFSNLQSEIKISSLGNGNNLIQSGHSNRTPPMKFYFDYSGLVLIHNEYNHEVLIVKLGSDYVLHNIKFPPSSMGQLNRSTICIRQFPFATTPANSACNLEQQQTNVAAKRDSFNSRRLQLTRDLSGDQSHLSLINMMMTMTTQANPIKQRLRAAYILPTNRTKLVLIDLVGNDNFPDYEATNRTNNPSRCLDHSCEISLIEFSLSSDFLLFVDAKNALYLLPTTNNPPGSKLQSIKLVGENCCKFASWLPRSEILIGQSDHLLFVCYEVNQLKQTGAAPNQKPIISSHEDTKICKLAKTRSLQVVDSRSFNPIGKNPFIDLSIATNLRSPGKLSSDNHPRISKLLPDFTVLLSNGKTMALDSVKVKFYTQLVDCSLKLASMVLENANTQNRQLSTSKSQQAFTSDNNHASLWIKLLWVAIEQSDCEVVVKSMQKLNYKQSWIDFFSQDNEKSISVHDENGPNISKALKLCLFKGDWIEFEKLAEPEIIQATYRRINKWTKLMDYLARMQQFRQRDLVERDYIQWLVSRGRHLDAAKLMARTGGDLAKALKLLINANLHVEAAQLLLSEHSLSTTTSMTTTSDYSNSISPDSLDKMLAELLRLEKFNLIARIYHFIRGKPEEALKFYVKAFNFEPAIRLACELAPERVANLRDAYAKQLMSSFKLGILGRRTALKAIEQYLMAKNRARAIESAVELDELSKAKEILISTRLGVSDEVDDASDEEELVQLGSKLCELYEHRGALEEAVECLKAGRQEEKISHFWLKHERYELAFEASLEYKHSGNRDSALDEFLALARSMESGKPEAAEQIYLEIIKKPQLAIQMHKALNNQDRLLELVQKFEPDQFESQLLLLAREYESLGRLDLAEKYMLRVSDSEWTNVVRMYRLAGNWEQAYRAAREHCSSKRDPLLVQLAFWWSRSAESMDKSREILLELDMLRPVIEFCCENRNYQFALELCNNFVAKAASSSIENYDWIIKLKGEIVRGQANQLEQQNKFHEAEQTLVRAGHLKEAIKMYLENEKYFDAIRLCEEQLKSCSSSNIPKLISEKSDQVGHSFSGEQLSTLLNETLVDCAKRLADDVIKPSIINNNQANPSIMQSSMKKLSPSDQAKLKQAQDLFLRAQKPELAVAMYQERAMWQEAIQLAQRYAPSLLEQVEQALDSLVSQDLQPIVAGMLELSGSPPSSPSSSNVRAAPNDPMSGTVSDETMQSDNQESLNEDSRREVQVSQLISKISDQQQRDPIGALMTLATMIDSRCDYSSEIGRQDHKSNIRILKDQLRFMEQMFNSRIVISLMDRNLESDAGVPLQVSLVKCQTFMLSACKWGLPAPSLRESLECWLSWLIIVEILAKSTIFRNSDSNIADIVDSARLIARHCELIDQFNVMWAEFGSKGAPGGRRTPGLKGRKSTRSRNAHGANGQTQASFLEITPTTAINFGARYPKFAELIKSIASQSLEVLNQLTMSHERHHSDLIYPTYVAGLWLLAAGASNGTRKLWTRLISTLDNNNNNNNNNSNNNGGAHDEFSMSQAAKMTIDEARIQEVRAWLLESLLNIDSGPNEMDLNFNIP